MIRTYRVIIQGSAPRATDYDDYLSWGIANQTDIEGRKIFSVRVDGRVSDRFLEWMKTGQDIVSCALISVQNDLFIESSMTTKEREIVYKFHATQNANLRQYMELTGTIFQRIGATDENGGGIYQIHVPVSRRDAFLAMLQTDREIISATTANEEDEPRVRYRVLIQDDPTYDLESAYADYRVSWTIGPVPDHQPYLARIASVPVRYSMGFQSRLSLDDNVYSWNELKGADAGSDSAHVQTSSSANDTGSAIRYRVARKPYSDTSATYVFLNEFDDDDILYTTWTSTDEVDSGDNPIFLVDVDPDWHGLFLQTIARDTAIVSCERMEDNGLDRIIREAMREFSGPQTVTTVQLLRAMITEREQSPPLSDVPDFCAGIALALGPQFNAIWRKVSGDYFVLEESKEN